MRFPSVPVNQIPQPPLFPTVASAISLQACVDAEAETVLFAVMSQDPISGGLQALWSSSPVPIDRHLDALHQAHAEFLSQLWDATGPFA